MIAKYAENQRNLMAALLTRDAFDPFELMSGTVTTYAQFTVDGTLRPAFFGEDEGTPADSLFTPWKDLKGYFLSVIRGRRTPLSFRFVFRLSADDMAALLAGAGLSGAAQSVSSFVLTLSFDGNHILVTTGVSRSAFSMDKRPEQAFDAYILDFFRNRGLVLRDPE